MTLSAARASEIVEMVLFRLRGSLTFLVVLLFLAIVNVITLYFFSVGMHQSQMPSSSVVDCSHYQNIINIQESLLMLQRNISSSNPAAGVVKNSSRAQNSPSSPTIYMITPTYTRPTQKADLSRLCYALMHVPGLHWIVVEDSDTRTSLVHRLLSGEHSCKMAHYTHLNLRTTKELRIGKNERHWVKSRGAEQRNHGVDWLFESAAAGFLGKLHDPAKVGGVVYFGDDDNTYDIQLFEEMRSTKRVSTWPVGLSGGLNMESPLCREGKVTGWNALWDKTRMFQIDMAGFAINLNLLLSKPKARFDAYSKQGHLESSLLRHLVNLTDLEAKASDCTKVLVWHTRTEEAKLRDEAKLKKQGKSSNHNIEV